MQVAYFWNIGTRAACCEFLFLLYREAVAGCDSKNKTKTTSPSNYSLEAAWKNNDISKYPGQEILCESPSWKEKMFSLSFAWNLL